MSDKTELWEKLRWIAKKLKKDLTRTQFKGRRLILKVKLQTYEVLIRQVIPSKAVRTANDLYSYSLPMPAKHEKEIPGMKLRLMGLRCAHLVSTKKTGIDFFGMRCLSSADGEPRPANTKVDKDGEWEAWLDEEFEEAARQERQHEMNASQHEMNELERLSQEQDTDRSDPPTQKPSSKNPTGASSTAEPSSPTRTPHTGAPTAPSASKDVFSSNV